MAPLRLGKVPSGLGPLLRSSRSAMVSAFSSCRLVRRLVLKNLHIPKRARLVRTWVCGIHRIYVIDPKQKNSLPNFFSGPVAVIYSASRGAAMMRASISLRRRVISSNFRSKASDIFFTRAGSVIFRLSAILACDLGRAGSRFFGKPPVCPCNLARNSNPK